MDDDVRVDHAARGVRLRSIPGRDRAQAMDLRFGSDQQHPSGRVKPSRGDRCLPDLCGRGERTRAGADPPRIAAPRQAPAPPESSGKWLERNNGAIVIAVSALFGMYFL